ncbi:MAG: cytochrome c-type biogenesis protein CcmH [Candidatus Limnocylindria bacterium]
MSEAAAGRRAQAGLVLAGLLAAVALVIAGALLLRPTQPATLEEQARAIASELRCPDCAGLSVADSSTGAAVEIRRQIDEQLAVGQTAEQITASFVARYGDWILLTPPGAVPWLVPLAATAVGAAILAWWLLGRGAAVVEPLAAVDGRATEKVSLSRTAARRLAVSVAATLAALLGIGFLVPEPFSLAAETVVNQPLAEAQAAEAARQAEIERLLVIFADDPTDTASLSDLADAYLAGSTAEDLQRGASVLLLLIGLDPDAIDPYVRLITAYIRAADWTDAAAATEALDELAPDSPDVPFFRGLIAWRGDADAPAAIEAFDDFLRMAPDDPRVPMVRALRQQAAATLD